MCTLHTSLAQFLKAYTIIVLMHNVMYVRVNS